MSEISKKAAERRRGKKTSLGRDDIPALMEGLGEGAVVTPPAEPQKPTGELEGAAADPDAGVEETPGAPAKAGDVRGLLAYLDEIREHKRTATNQLMKMVGADKDEIALLKLKKEHLESEEKATERQLKLLHKKTLEGMDGIDKILIEIVDYTGEVPTLAGSL